MYDITIQLIGYVGLVFAVIAFQCKQHKNVMIFRTLNEVIFAIQYFCLASYTGVVMNLIGSVRNIIFARQIKKEKSTLIWQILFSLMFVVIGILTTNGIVSIMAILAKVVTTIAYSLKNTKYIRFLTLPTSICWLVYNIMCNSSAGILCEAFTICSIVTAIIRIDILKR